MDLSSSVDCGEVEGNVFATGESLDSAAASEPTVEAVDYRTQSGELAHITSTRMMTEQVNSSAMGRSAQLVAEHSWSSRTSRKRGSQWRTWLSFGDADGRQPLPFTEAHFSAFFGWI